jgi:hypothetical protein
MTSREEVRDFIEKFTSVVRAKGMVYVNRSINLREMSFSGYFGYQIEEIVTALSPGDYVEGPLGDRDKSAGEIWVFVKKVDQIDMYIKLKLDKEAKCISFHTCKYKAKFPFRKADD